MRNQWLFKLIPGTLKINNKVAYEVVWVMEFPDPKQVGETRWPARQIVLKKNETPLNTFKTFWLHELFHAMSYEYPEMKLSELQVQQLEKASWNFIKVNSVLDIVKKLI